MPCILIVDSEPFQRLLVCELLSDDPSLTFIEASREAEALRLVSLYRPDLVIFDIYSPYRDGFHIYEQLCAVPDIQNIPVIFTTAVLVENLKTYFPGEHPLIFKPFEGKELQTAVHEALNHSAPTSALTNDKI